mmetsp:Transcript_33988/g.33136  ORF Transcript_33988/g.33136 Transcript_33988/m.33136 type:complete len:99 (+) Transcript_33988:172-468(+)
MYVTNGDFMSIKFKEPTTFNRLNLVFPNYDNRFYTYGVDYSSDSITWETLLEEERGKGAEVIKLDEPITPKYLRLTGFNSENPEFHLLHISLDYLIKD